MNYQNDQIKVIFIVKLKVENWNGLYQKQFIARYFLNFHLMMVCFLIFILKLLYHIF
jgi:hypothetical protein